MRCEDCSSEIPPVNHARTAAGKQICLQCADAREREALKSASVYGAYVSGDGKSLTTWPGGILASVTRETRHRGAGFYRSDIWSYRAKAPDGSRWYGRGAGRGMFLTIRRVK